MPKRFDCEDEPNDFMDMPCRCDCGKFFDLTDGYPSRTKNITICKECKDLEEELQLGDLIIFTSDCVINSKTRAEKHEKGRICNRCTPYDQTVSIKLTRNKYPIHHVPVSIIEKIFY